MGVVKKLGALACALALSVSVVGCGGQAVSIPELPQQIDAVDQDVKAGAAKALGILVSAARLANRISLMEDEAARAGAIPAEADAVFDKGMVAYANASDAAVARIAAGVTTWAELRAHVEPVLDQVNQLAAMAQQVGVIRSQVGAWLMALRDIVLELVTGGPQPAPQMGGA